jgi:site-specific DNA recombinase
LDELDAIGVELHAVMNGGLVPRLTSNILAVIADEESRLLGERVSEMSQYLQSQGWLVGRVPNWGYQWRDATPAERLLNAPRRVLDINPDEAPYVQECWQRASQGQSLRSLVKWAAGLPLVARGGRSLGFAALRCVLMSPVYVARCATRQDVEAGEDILAGDVGHWPALATDEQWRAVRDGCARHQAQPRQASGKYLLTGFVRCPSCGGRMVGCVNRQKQRGTGARGAAPVYEVFRYLCFGPQGGAGASVRGATCHKSVNAPSLEEDVLRQLGDALSVLMACGSKTEDLIRMWWAERQQANLSLSPDAEYNRKRLLATIDAGRQSLGNALRLLTDGKTDADSYQAMREQVQAEIDGARAELRELEQTTVKREPLPDIDEVLRELGGWHRALTEAPVDRKRAVLSILVATVTPVRVKLGRYCADVQWTAIGQAVLDLAGQAAQNLAPAGPLAHAGAGK